MNNIRKMALAATLMASTTATAADPPGTIRVPVVDSYTVHIDVPPDVMWAELKTMYISAAKFAAQGYDVKQLDDPTAFLGGTVIRKVLPSGEVEERVARFTRIDDRERLLALQVRYSEGIAGNVSYEVRPAGRGSDFQLIAHMEQDIPVDPKNPESAEALAARVEQIRQGHHKALAGLWQAEKARLEAAH